MRIDDVYSPGLNPAGIQPGWLDTLPFPNPAAGSAFTRAVPGELGERLITVTATLTTSAVVANRIVSITYLDRSGNAFASVQMSNAVVASSSVTVFGMATWPVSAKGASGISALPIPDLLLTPGMSWQLSVSNMDAGDTLTGINSYMWRFPATALLPQPGG
jgi:hypothetical protein